MAKMKKKKVLQVLNHGIELGVALGVLLAMERNGVKPFVEGGRGATYDEFKEMLRRDYCVDIDAGDWDAIMNLFNVHPHTKMTMHSTGKSVHQADTSGTAH